VFHRFPSIIDWKVQFPNVDKLRCNAIALPQLTEYKSRGMSTHSPFARGSKDDWYGKRTDFIHRYKMKTVFRQTIFPIEKYLQAEFRTGSGASLRHVDSRAEY